MMPTYFLSLLAALITGLVGLAPASAAVFQAGDKGTRVTVDLEGPSQDRLQAGQSVRVKIQVGEPDSHHDSTLIHRPAAWISPRLSEQVAREVPCREKVKRFSSGRLADRAEIDLTSYLLVTLNQDKTIGFINPYVALNRTKLESLVVLPANGLDWAQNDDGTRLAVTMPDAHAVAVIDTESRTIAHLIDTGAGTHPTRILWDTLGHRMWVGLDHDTRVLALDILKGTIETTVSVGAGVHSLTQSTDGTYVFVANSDAGTVSIIDAKTMQQLGQVVTGHTPLAMAWSTAVNLLYVAHVNEDVIVALDPITRRIV
jgi:YVTN family beta-propeller protein